MCMDSVRAVLPVCVSVHIHHTCSRMEKHTQQLRPSEDNRDLNEIVGLHLAGPYPPVDRHQGTQGCAGEERQSMLLKQLV